VRFAKACREESGNASIIEAEASQIIARKLRKFGVGGPLRSVFCFAIAGVGRASCKAPAVGSVLFNAAAQASVEPSINRRSVTTEAPGKFGGGLPWLCSQGLYDLLVQCLVHRASAPGAAVIDAVPSFAPALVLGSDP
jgi:hypothetical protein